MTSATNIICLVMSQLAPSGSKQIVRATPVIWAIVRWSPDCWAIVRQSLGNHVNLNHHKLPLTGLVVSEGKKTRILVVRCLTSNPTMPYNAINLSDKNKARIKALKRNALSRWVFVAYISAPIHMTDPISRWSTGCIMSTGVNGAPSQGFQSHPTNTNTKKIPQIEVQKRSHQY